ncbi:MAG: helix-turn-helix domain-containing protein [Methanobrevibacter sp.]|jgi:transposase|nr:helix-turn-helix domain-containing protein [Candidatus Methanovirga aequatorialis]
MKFKLEEEDEVTVNKLLKKSKEEFRLFILVLLNNSDLNQKEIAKILDITPKTVSKIKKRYLDEGLESALNDKPRSGQPKKYDDEKEAEIIALACTDPPEGRKQWTARLVAEEMKQKTGFETINRETVRLVLKKATQSHGPKK